MLPRRARAAQHTFLPWSQHYAPVPSSPPRSAAARVLPRRACAAQHRASGHRRPALATAKGNPSLQWQRPRPVHPHRDEVVVKFILKPQSGMMSEKETVKCYLTLTLLLVVAQDLKTLSCFPPQSFLLLEIFFFSITTNKASEGDEMTAEVFKILKEDAVKVLHSMCQQIWKPQQWLQDWKRSVFILTPRKGNAKECSNYCIIALTSHSSK